MEKLTKPGVAGILEKTEDGVDYILIQERFKEDAPLEEGLLEIPAGKIREFENIYDCLRREVTEETGLEVVAIDGEEEAVVVESNGYRVLSYTPFASAQNIHGNYPIMVQVFICKVKGEIALETNESRNIRWISLSDLRDLLNFNQHSFYPMSINTLKKYLKYKEELKINTI